MMKINLDGPSITKNLEYMLHNKIILQMYAYGSAWQ